MLQKKKQKMFVKNRNGLEKLLIIASVLLQLNGLCLGYKNFVPSPQFDLSDSKTFVDYRKMFKHTSNINGFKPTIGHRYDVYKRSHPVPITPFVVERGSITFDENGKISQEKIIMPTLFRLMPHTNIPHTNIRPTYHIDSRNRIYTAKKPIDTSLPEGLHAPFFIDNSEPFKPIMVPSQQNLEPMKPPTFQTTRSKVKEIRERTKNVLQVVEPGKEEKKKVEISQAKVEEIRGKNKDFFEKEENDNIKDHEIFYAQYLEPNDNSLHERTDIPVTEVVDDIPQPRRQDSNTHRSDQPSQLDKELEYFQSREREIGNPEVMTTTKRPVKQETINGSQSKTTVKQNSKERETKSESKTKKQLPGGNKRFVPTKRYTQVRHSITNSRKPTPEDEPTAKQKISTLKKQIVYSEDGYDDENYDHGGEQKHGEFKTVEKPKAKKPTRTHERRPKRDVSASDVNDDDEQDEIIPVALALVQSKNGPRLSGNELLAYISEVIKNSTLYAPDEVEESDPKLIKSSKIGHFFSIPIKKPSLEKKTSESKNQYHFYNLPSDITRKPSHSVSPYERTKNQNCNEDDDGEIDPTSSDSSKQPQRRLHNLDGKINCLKNKYFGENPFDSSFYQDEYVSQPSSQSLQIALKTPNDQPSQRSPQTSNHLITVYDDIIHNIKTTLSSDEENSEENNDESVEVKENLSFEPFKTKTTQVFTDTVNSETTKNNQIFNMITDKNIKDFSLLKLKRNNDNLSSAAYSIFDITQYFPKGLAQLPLEDHSGYESSMKSKFNSYRDIGDATNQYGIKIAPTTTKPSTAPRQILAASTTNTRKHIAHLPKSPKFTLMNYSIKPKLKLPSLRRRKRYRYDTIIFI
jgi:hypothetical protein